MSIYASVCVSDFMFSGSTRFFLVKYLVFFPRKTLKTRLCRTNYIAFFPTDSRDKCFSVVKMILKDRFVSELIIKSQPHCQENTVMNKGVLIIISYPKDCSQKFVTGLIISSYFISYLEFIFRITFDHEVILIIKRNIMGFQMTKNKKKLAALI